ncbi:RnfABCDGE type electron transport complex subunit G [Butyrivibrio sp. WCD3002]|jgi:electron transport complex protein RnfG|uniref:RnfABCDGE type electron transport complex subunit G n=1 Tax=Butyrivibrio sp. WCD3002 TaxID=1280676 RepID=UPI000400CC04|nr:RnfABCDGE type electron transport complex subunit G [Butyrivibrio sp. WCD3002]
MRDIKTLIKNALVLFVITLVAGVSLGFVYQVTKEPIAEQERLAQVKANQAVFPDAADFTDEALDEAVAAQVLSNADYGKIEISSVKKAVDSSGNGLGYVIQVTSGGYGDKIVFTVGITNEASVNGISLISINETPGLGMNAEKVIVPQFAGKPATVFSVTKNAAASDSEIEAISGATITSKAVTYGVNAAVEYFQSALQ